MDFVILGPFASRDISRLYLRILLCLGHLEIVQNNSSWEQTREINMMCYHMEIYLAFSIKRKSTSVYSKSILGKDYPTIQIWSTC